MRGSTGGWAFSGAVAALLLGALGFLAGQAHGDADARTRLARETRTLRADTAALRDRMSLVESRQAGEADTSTISKTVLRSVFTVDTDKGLGTAFVISSSAGKSNLLTDFHVVADVWNAGQHQVTLRQEGRPQLTGTITKVDTSADLALIQAESALPALTRASASPVVGDPVVVVGSPLGLDGTVSTGIVSALRDAFLQFSAPVSPGSSGGPVVDRAGHVLGIARAKEVGTGAEGLSFATPIAVACATLSAC